MEMIFGIYFFIMGSVVMLLSLIITFIFKRVPFYFTVIFFMLVGVICANIFGMHDGALGVAVFNGFTSLLAVGLVKLGFYAGHVAEKRMNR
ncbi:hypothetical protein [Sutcliffiella rhizosphaerae]|uniref:YesK-like protein n=1 Tax=Sutcliffiella rhizosphaerae TaxID=2880967 RepID=A0ABM8YKV8_9BACI|nr:hypothetical protein [Sutcliffiella rhizosphaerae]CAG9620423.1 hypothetical protein BACCIP111883_01191 [Sutcliffiella rhizosphaerae]